MSYNYLFKLIVVGKENVGKTCLVDTWCGRPFRAAFESTVGVDFDAKRVLIDGDVIKNHIWDITGQQKFSTIVSAYYGKCAGAFVVFDVTNKQSFFNIDHWIQEIKAKNDRQVPIVIIGTKIDKPNRTVSTEEATLFAGDRGLQYIETSAKKGEKIEESFQLLINEIYSNIDADLDNLSHGIKRGALGKSDKLRYGNCEPCEDEWRCCFVS